MIIYFSESNQPKWLVDRLQDPTRASSLCLTGASVCFCPVAAFPGWEMFAPDAVSVNPIRPSLFGSPDPSKGPLLD